MDLPDVDKHTDCNSLIVFFLFISDFILLWDVKLINIFSQKIKLVTYVGPTSVQNELYCKLQSVMFIP